RREIPHHYPVLVAAGYLGLMTWHGGFSGTAPLMVSTEAGITSVLPTGTVLDPIPLSQTIFGSLNIIVTGGLILIGVLGMAMLMPKQGGSMCPAASQTTKQSEDRVADEPKP